MIPKHLLAADLQAPAARWVPGICPGGSPQQGASQRMPVSSQTRLHHKRGPSHSPRRALLQWGEELTPLPCGAEGPFANEWVSRHSTNSGQCPEVALTSGLCHLCIMFCSLKAPQRPYVVLGSVPLRAELPIPQHLARRRDTLLMPSLWERDTACSRAPASPISPEHL